MVNTDRKIVLEFINRIFVDYSPLYKDLKKLAQEDPGEKLLKEIKDFLDKKKDIKKKPEFKKLVFEDASNVQEEDINDIVDAFIRMRQEGTLSQIEEKSINDILILFNQWVMIGKGQFDKPILPDIFSEILGPKHAKNLEEQVMKLEPDFMRQSPLYPLTQSRDVYSTVIDRQAYSSFSNEVYVPTLDTSRNYFGHGGYVAQRQDNL